MGAPVLIGAGIGAATSLATGQNPFKGALLGGIGGGAFGGSTGFGSGFTEGGLFNLGSMIPSATPTVGTTAATTAFGANQAPLAGLSAISPQATTTAGLNAAYEGPVSSTVGGIHQGAGLSPESVTSPISKYTGAIHTQDQAQLARAAQESTGQTFTDGVADQIMPRFKDYTQISEQATKTGGYTEPFYKQAVNSAIDYAKQNPLQVGGLALVASGGITPKQPQVSAPSVGSITKGTPPQQAGQILKVKRPTRYA